MNSLSSFCDALVNLAVIFQFTNPRCINALNMFFLSIILEPNNSVANIDYNNLLRETNNKDLSDNFIRMRIFFDNKEYEILNLIKKENKEIKDFSMINTLYANSFVNFEENNSSIIFCLKIFFLGEISFVCMKWGKKYDAEYVNKLYRGIKRNITKIFDFYCITEDRAGLLNEIKSLDLDMKFKGWMRKSILFDFNCMKKNYFFNKRYKKFC